MPAHNPCLLLYVTLVVVDQDKGFNAAFKRNFENASKFSCGKHKGDNLVKHGAKGDKAAYEQALRAPSAEALKNAKAEYSKKGSAYMAKMPDSELYLFVSGRANCGKTSSQVSESSNAANLKMRGAKIASGLIAFFGQEMDRVLRHKEAAEKHDVEKDGHLPPNMRRLVKQMDDTDMTRPGGSRAVDLNAGGWATVHSSTLSGVSYIVRSGKLTCSCGRSALTTYPCGACAKDPDS